MIVLMSHVRTLRWASIMPAVLVNALGSIEGLQAIPITAPDVVHTIGLVAPRREPSTPMVTALVSVARQLAQTMAQEADA